MEEMNCEGWSRLERRKRRDDEIDLAEDVVMADFLVLSCYEGYSRPRSFAHRPLESYASKQASKQTQRRKSGQSPAL